MLEPDADDVSVLAKDDLAQMFLSFLLERVDTRSSPYEVRRLPRRLKKVTTDAVLTATGETWLCATVANNGIPPLAQACDNHPSQNVFNQFFWEYFGELPTKMYHSGVPASLPPPRARQLSNAGHSDSCSTRLTMCCIPFTTTTMRPTTRKHFSKHLGFPAAL